MGRVQFSLHALVNLLIQSQVLNPSAHPNSQIDPMTQGSRWSFKLDKHMLGSIGTMWSALRSTCPRPHLCFTLCIGIGPILPSQRLSLLDWLWCVKTMICSVQLWKVMVLRHDQSNSLALICVESQIRLIMLKYFKTENLSAWSSILNFFCSMTNSCHKGLWAVWNQNSESPHSNLYWYGLYCHYKKARAQVQYENASANQPHTFNPKG